MVLSQGACRTTPGVMAGNEPFRRSLLSLAPPYPSATLQVLHSDPHSSILPVRDASLTSHRKAASFKNQVQDQTWPKG